VVSQSEKLARAAGIYSGEGGLYCYEKPKTNITLKVGQNNCDYEPLGTPSMLAQFLDAVELGKIQGPYKRAACRYSTWTYIASQDAAVAVFEKIKPWLSTAKRLQGEEAIAGWVKIQRHHRWGPADAYPCGHARTPENTNVAGTNPHCRECCRLRNEKRNRRIAAEKRALKAAATM
jgi:hypothetical protein